MIRQSHRLRRFFSDLLGRSPVRAAGVQGIEHDIAALLVIEALDVLAGRVIDDGGVATVPDLREYLRNESRLARAGVADQLKVLRLVPSRNAHPVPHVAGLEPYPVASYLLVERFRREHHRPLQPPPVLQGAEAMDVARDGEREKEDEDEQSLAQADRVGLDDALSVEDRHAKPTMDRYVGVDLACPVFCTK